MAASTLDRIGYLLVCLTMALAIALLLRLPLRALFGARLAYAIWIVVPMVVSAAALPVPELLAAGMLPQASQAVLPMATTQWIAGLDRSVFDVDAGLFAFWATGATLLCLIQIWQQYAFVRQLKPMSRTPTGEWIATGKRVARAGEEGSAATFSPAVVGAFRPRIVLPADFEVRYTLQEQELVLAHERMHLKRRDPAVNLVLAALRVVFWFHPLVHVAARCLRADQELACDADVVATRPQCRRAYAQAILKTQLISAASPVGCQWESRTASSLERRFAMLKTSGPSHSRHRAGVILMGVATLASASFAWAAQPQAESPKPFEFAARDLDDLIHRAPNGHPLLLLKDGQVISKAEAEKIPLAAIERIEVLPASAAATYGPAAIHGVINFVMKREPAEKQAPSE